MKHNQEQVRELLTRYGPIAVMFYDGPSEGLLDLTWDLQPNTVITRGAMETPEISPSATQGLPGETLSAPWEACFTMGTSWQFKPTNEKYLTGGELIELLIETRAKGGTMLLNIGPAPEGEIPPDQENRLREIGLWNLVNGEAVFGVRPWVITNEGDIWFTRKKDEDTVYAIVTNTEWKFGERKTFTLRSVGTTPDTIISVLGQNDLVLEYQPDVVPKTTWREGEEGLHITATRAQRLYNDRTWPNPVVLRIKNAKSGLE
jgi:alpha-L-fucosidase